MVYTCQVRGNDVANGRQILRRREVEVVRVYIVCTQIDGNHVFLPARTEVYMRGPFGGKQQKYASVVFLWLIATRRHLNHVLSHSHFCFAGRRSLQRAPQV